MPTSLDPRIQRRRLLQLTSALALPSLPMLGKASSAWPAGKPIRINVSVSPGGSPDLYARAFAEYAAKVLGAPATVENKPGGAGMIAASHVAKSPADGLTLLMINHGQLAQAAVMLKKPLIDADRDVLPIASFGFGAAPACVNSKLPVNSFQDLIALARTRPVSVGNYAMGSGWHMMIEQLMKQTGAQFTLVHYKGTGQMVQDLMSGAIDLGAGSLIGMKPGIDGGHFKPVLLISGRKFKDMPELPTWREVGFVGPVFQDLEDSVILAAPKGTPQPVVELLARTALDAASKSDNLSAVFRQFGVDSKPVLIGADLQALIRRVRPVFREQTKALGLQAQ